jgi:hypothetical protein
MMYLIELCVAYEGVSERHVTSSPAAARMWLLDTLLQGSRFIEDYAVLYALSPGRTPERIESWIVHDEASHDGLARLIAEYRFAD